MEDNITVKNYADTIFDKLHDLQEENKDINKLIITDDTEMLNAVEHINLDENDSVVLSNSSYSYTDNSIKRFGILECTYKLIVGKTKKEALNVRDKNLKLLVKTGDILGYENNDDSLTPYEVICADDKTFVVAEIMGDEIDPKLTHTTYDNLYAYSNLSYVNSLKDLHFIKLED